jgi:hypothetical protein|nr:MAG TPA: holin protein [Caudoviricetes sp.]
MNDILVAIISALSSSGFMSLILYKVQKKDKQKDIESAQSRLLIGLAHDRILSLTDALVKRGNITLKEKRNLEYLYKPYKEAGGNGDCKIGYEACQKLEVISDEKGEL